jgi:hypothetical protein
MQVRKDLTKQTGFWWVKKSTVSVKQATLSIGELGCGVLVRSIRFSRPWLLCAYFEFALCQKALTFAPLKDSA